MKNTMPPSGSVWLTDQLKRYIPFMKNGSMTSIFKIVPIAFIILLFVNTGVKAQKEFDGGRGTHRWMRFTDAPNALYNHIATQAYGFLDKRSGRIAELNTLSDWKQRQQWIRTTLMDMIGPFPDKTPLNAKITKVINKDGYRVENLIYESQPGFYVSSSLFIPDGLKQGDKAPAVIYCSGHTKTGYRSRTYQRVILNLVKKGFIVFAFDPIGQGERLQYYVPENDKSYFRFPSYEHSYAGAQVFLTGSSLARYMIWDGIRAVDYLLSRKEVDPARIGITGRSGGGTQSAYIAAFDERIKAVAPENYITNFTRLFQSFGPQCAEQNFFNGIAQGLDMADLLLVRAPKPALMITTTRDMFPIQGAMETANEVSRLYEAYGKAGDFAMVTDDAPHASTKKNRESMYAFFQKHLDNPGDSSDQEVEILSAEALQVTKTGQVSTSLKAETVFSLNLKEAERLNDRLRASGENNTESFSAIMESAKRLSGYRKPREIHEPVFTGRIQREGYTIEKYFVKGEGDYVIPYLLMKPEKINQKALIYLHPSGKSADAEVGGEMEWFVRNGFTVLAPDIIGTGEMGPGVFRGDSYIDSVSYNIWFASMLIGRSIVGIQAGDVVRLVNLLKTNDGTQQVYALAKKQMAPVLLHAAVFDSAIANIALVEPYSSYRSIVANCYYNPKFIHSTVPGAIAVYDLPDLAGMLAPRKLVIAGVTDGTGDSTKTEIMREDMLLIKEAYKSRGIEEQLLIVQEKSTEKLFDTYKEWINE